MVHAEPEERSGALVSRLGGCVDRLDGGSLAQEFRLIVGKDAGRRVKTRFDGELVQEAKPQRVHGPDRGLVQQLAVRLQRRVRHHRAPHSLAHLRRGCFGEGDSRDLRDGTIPQQPQVALDQDVRLAAPRAGHDRNVGGFRLDDRPLLDGQVHCFHRLNWLTRQM